MARIRTFIAVDIGDPIRERTAALQKELGGASSAVKWVEPENMHITLLFLGEVDQLDILPICKATANAVKNVGAFPMTIGGLGAFPNTRRPKILWAAVQEGVDELRELHAKIEAPLMDLGAYRREDRGYTPHLTLGRLGAEDDSGHWSQLIARRGDWHAGEVTVREVLIMASELGRNGPVYTIQGRARLAAAGKPKEED